MNDEIYAIATTNASGQATLNFTTPPTTPGSFTLTVTAWNANPYQVQISIIPPSGPYVVYENCTIDDDLMGNNNGQLDYGEQTQLGLTLENVGVAIANGVTATISSADTMITIITNTASFGNIAPGATSTVSHAYTVSLDEGVEDGHALNFSVNAQSGDSTWVSNFVVIAHAPNMVFNQLIINDAVGGNGNGNLDPGETADLLLNIINDGSSAIVGVQAVLTTADPFITINNGSCYLWGVYAPGQIAPLVFNITVDQNCPQEHTVAFSTAVSNSSGGYNTTVGFATTVGDILFLPTGPDDYGYLAYDSNDAPFLPEYEWVEISPDSGGPGMLVNFTNDDQTLQFELPFTFQYYGLDYDTISVCSNGFIAMGRCGDTDYSNSAIPNSDGPPAMVATYWEDLSPQRTNSGRVWYYYDAVNHLYIVEFNHIEQFSPLGSFETFQTIFYDPAYYPTLSGDGQIKMQYKSMSTTSQTEGTVGIENHLEDDGIQYLFDGSYDVHAAPLISQIAVLYTTPVEAPDVSVTLTPAVTPVIIPPGGGSFTFNTELENSGLSMVSIDFWIEAVLPGGSVYGPIILREGVNLGAGAIITRDLVQNIPASAPPGTYTYRANIGGYPNMVYSTDSFPFEKLAGEGGIHLINDWGISGWDEPANAVANIPQEFTLKQNYPNPFNPETAIEFGLPEACKVQIEIYNALGNRIGTLIEGNLAAGNYRMKWNADHYSAGIYFLRMKAGDYTAMKKMVLIK
jgi:hypothetical protein